jgi:acyl-CoA reductase-like NAD-dependent aldehyde dehydrogenase
VARTPPRPPEDPPSHAELDATVAALAIRARAWAVTSPLARARLLDRVIDDTLAVADDWLRDACDAKGLGLSSPEAGEELFAGVGTFVRMARLLRDALRDIAEVGRPRYPGPVRRADDGRLRVGVFPASTYDRLLFPGTTGEVWMEPGVTEEEVRAGQAAAYRDPAAAAGVALVLAAGNVASLGPRDVLSKMFVEGKVVLLKANPVNAYLLAHWRRAFAGLVGSGFLAMVDGDASVGAYLSAHPGIDCIHVTGSAATHDAIVFGTGPDGARRKAAGEPVLNTPVTAELGNVSPVVVVPGRWSAADLVYQAQHVATMIVNNAGFNCLTPRVLVTQRRWPQREAFLGALTRALASQPLRRAYYPGAAARHHAVVAAHPDAELIGTAQGDELPWTLVRGVAPGQVHDICFTTEAFCGLCAETPLEADDPAAFVAEAVAFCNDVLWGTLSATVLAHPSTLADPVTGPAVQRAVADLRYGAVGLNLWHGFVFALSATTWGAYPGHPLHDIGSGRGVVGNASMFDRPCKSVVRGPFRARPAPAWFAGHRHQLAVMRRLVAFEGHPSRRALPGLLATALRP